MAAVISMVEAIVPPDRVAALSSAYSKVLASGRPPSILHTYLVARPPDRVAVITIWRSREDLQAMLDSGQEPVARRLIREAGGTPEASFLDVLVAGE